MTHPVLDLPMQTNDAEAATIRDYFKALLTTLLIEEEGFSGKRPFGNSGWISDLEIPLIKAGLVQGKIDADGYVEESDDEAIARVLLGAVKDL